MRRHTQFASFCYSVPLVLFFLQFFSFSSAILIWFLQTFLIIHTPGCWVGLVRMFRRAAARFIPLAIRSKPKLCNASVLNFQNRRFSTTADDDIAHLIISDVNRFRTSPDVEIPSHIPFPFDIATENPATRTITLMRKTTEEIICVDVSDSLEEYYVDDQIPDYYDGEYLYGNDQVPNDEDDQVPDDQGSNNKKDIPCLYMQVVIYYGPNYGRRLMFFVMAFRDRIGVRTVVMRAGHSRLELFDKYFKDRGIVHDAMRFLLHHVRQ